MKPYGSDHEPRLDREFPDAADIRHLGLPSSLGWTRSKRKRATRRRWKRKERQSAREALRRELMEKHS